MNRLLAKLATALPGLLVSATDVEEGQLEYVAAFIDTAGSLLSASPTAAQILAPASKRHTSKSSKGHSRGLGHYQMDQHQPGRRRRAFRRHTLWDGS
jgi:hypothetical protein